MTLPELHSDDVVQKVVDFASSMLLDVLALAVVSRQYNAAVQRTVAASAASCKQRPHARWLLTDRMAQHFCSWSQLAVSGFGDHVPMTASGVEIPEGDAVVYHCCRCRCPILRCRDIVSTNYHGAWGPAFLVDRLYNAAVERASYAAAFVTGSYTVSDVACACCRLMLGKKYVEARDPVNRFKVGKYLLEQTMVFLPGCCSGSTSWQQGSAQRPHEDGSSICVRCTVHLQSRTVQAVLLMTGGFLPGASRQLREALTEEQELMHRGRAFGSTTLGLQSASATAAAGAAAARKRYKPPPRRGEDAASQSGIDVGGVERYVEQELSRNLSRRLGDLCGALLPGGVEAKLLATFVDQVASSVVSCSYTSNGGRQGHRDVLPTSCSAGGGSSRGSGHGFEGHRDRGAGGGPAMGPHSGIAPFAPGVRTSRRHIQLRHGPGHAELEQPGIGASAFAGDGGGPGSAAGKPDTVAALSRLARWELIAPAAAVVCRDFHGARGLVACLNTAWQPSFPAERPGAERLIEHMASRLGLDPEDRGLLLQEMGLKKPASCCLWFPCRVSL